MNDFKTRIQNLAPEHDTPVGLIHPYWARKPLNIIQELCKYFSEPGDTIVDPFVGSGTTVFAALSQNRKVVGADINPLAIFVSSSIIELHENSTTKLHAVDLFLKDFTAQVLPWFHYRDDLYVERERYSVVGDYENGNFELVHTEVVLKTLQGDQLRGRTAIVPGSIWTEKKFDTSFICNPLDFNRLNLTPNSRIAIPNGATLAHYFEPKNQAAINFALSLIESGKYGAENNKILKLLVSSALPLLRLSDKKASSQWPYWRPKTNLTSRNPVIILKKKYKAIKNAAEWLKQNFEGNELGKVSQNVSFYNVSIQDLVPHFVDSSSADLVITDPPYSDQAPYLEYSSLWVQILGLDLPIDAFKKEIVKTDAATRIADDEEYTSRLRDGLHECFKIAKPGGIVAWFYQDHSIKHWSILSEEANRIGLKVKEVIPIPKQRRSMKTVTSPGKTLDGDLILIFVKSESNGDSYYHNSSDVYKLICRALEQLPSSASYFDKYATIVEVGLKYNLMTHISDFFLDVRDVLEDVDQRGNNVLASLRN